jgi:hypothetical protein
MKIIIDQVDCYGDSAKLKSFETDSISELMKEIHKQWLEKARNKNVMQQGERYIVSPHVISQNIGFPRETILEITLYDTYIE